MSLTQRQRTVLLGVLEDVQQFANLSADAHAASRLDLGRRRVLAQNARAGVVPMNLDGWLGRPPTNSERVVYHREYGRLEHMGLIQRLYLGGGRRTTHLKLTPTGRRVAEDLLAAEYGPDVDEDIDWSNVEFTPVEMPGEDGPALP